MSNAENQCNYCVFGDGDCEHFFVTSDGEKCPGVPDLCCCDQYGWCGHFKRKEPWITRISGKRQTGRTTKLIKLCRQMNKDHGTDDTVIVVADDRRVMCIYEMAKKLGYGDMPYPIPINYATAAHMHGSHYKYALIDDVEYVLQTVLGNGLQLRGYVEEENDPWI